jgi:hypothetical protein
MPADEVHSTTDVELRSATLTSAEPRTCLTCGTDKDSAHHSVWASDGHEPVLVAESPPQRHRYRSHVQGVNAGPPREDSDAILADPSPTAPSESRLDVERLAEAWANVMDGRHIPGHETRIRRDTTTMDDWHAIVAEYAALSDSENESA